MGFLLQYWDVLAFYSIVILLLYIFRKKFQFQGIIALYKTKLGVSFMERTGKKHPVFWHRLGLLSIILGFTGMIFITIYLFYGVYALFFVPGAPPTLSPVIPGVKIPGVPITFPLWYTLIGLFCAVIVHEVSHGIWSSAYKVKIKSSGFAFFGPLPAAFVEPDEKTMAKKTKRQQLAVLSGGPFANVILAIVAFIIMLCFSVAAGSLTNELGVQYGAVQNNSAAATAGFPSNGTITAINAEAVGNTAILTAKFAAYKPGDMVNATINNATYTVTLGENPDKKGKAYMGVLGVTTKYELKSQNTVIMYDVLILIGTAFVWIYIISFGIGLANLLPIGPVDGGRMFLLALMAVYPEKKAKQVWVRWSYILLCIVLVLVFVPIIKALL